MPDGDPETRASVARVPQEVTGQPRRVVVGSGGWRHMFSALRHRNFRLFFGGQIISLTGSWIQSTAQSWLIYELTGSKVLLGTVAAIQSLPMLLFSVFGGSIADRYPKRLLVIWTQTTMMLLAFLFAGLVWSGHIEPWHILALSALGGTAMAFDMPARQAFMIELTGREDLMNAVSLNSSAVNSARVIGPATAGLLIAHVGMTVCFLLNGISFVAVLAGLFLMRLPKFVPPARNGSAGSHLLEGFKYVATHRQVRSLLLLFAVVGIFGWSYSVLLPAYASEVLHVDERGFGTLLSANGLGALLGALTVAAWGTRINPRWMVLGGLWIFSGMLLTLAFVRSYPVALGCLAVGGWGMLLYFATTNTLIQTSVADHMRGRVMGIWALVFGGMMPLGGLESGFVSQALGVPITIMIGAVVCGAAGVVTWLLGNARRERSAREQE